MSIAGRLPEQVGPRADVPRSEPLAFAGPGSRAAVTGAAEAAAGRPVSPLLLHRRDGILPAVAGALSVRGITLTGTGSRGGNLPALHPLVAEFLAALPVEHRERHVGRCTETLLLSRYLAFAEESRSGRRAGRAFTAQEARKALKQARLATRHVREEGDPLHGTYASPCRSCARLLDHFGVTAVDPGASTEVREAG